MDFFNACMLGDASLPFYHADIPGGCTENSRGAAQAGDVEVLVLRKCHNLTFSDDSLSQHVSAPRSNAIKRHARVLLVLWALPCCSRHNAEALGPQGPNRTAAGAHPSAGPPW